MNKDVLLSLGKLKGIESAEIISSSIFSAISEDAQDIYSEQMDQSTDFGYANFSGLYSDLIQNEYSDEDFEKKIKETAEPLIDAYAKQAAKIQQISFSTEVYSDMRDQISQIVYSQIDDDLTALEEASTMSMSEFAEQLTGDDPDEEVYASFEELDTDGDGVISREEWEAAGLDPDEFDKIDADSDGVIERNEFDDYYL